MREITLVIKSEKDETLEQLCEFMKKLQGDVVEATLTAENIKEYTPEYITIEKEEYKALVHSFLTTLGEHAKQVTPEDQDQQKK